MTSTLVVCEAGHGGGDPGAVVAGVREADIVACVAHRLGALSADGILYSIKRRGAGPSGLRDLLHQIREAKPPIVLSLHCDSSAGPVEIHRCSVQWLKDRQDSARLALLIADHARRPIFGFAQEAITVCAPYERDGKPFVPGILRLGRKAACLVELGFLSDVHTRTAMLTAEWQQRAAETIDAAVRKFLGM